MFLLFPHVAVAAEVFFNPGGHKLPIGPVLTFPFGLQMSTAITSLKSTFSNRDDVLDIVFVAGVLAAYSVNIAYFFG